MHRAYGTRTPGLQNGEGCVSYHSTVFANSELRRLLKGEDLSRIQLTCIKGKPARTKGVVRWKGDVGTVFGSSFVAKVRRYAHKVIK